MTHSEWFKGAFNGLTHDQIIVAGRNFGIDLTCGGCASIFYTGWSEDHDETCQTHSTIKSLRQDVVVTVGNNA